MSEHTEMLTVVQGDQDFHCMFCGTKTIEMPGDVGMGSPPTTNSCEHLRFIAIEGGFEYLAPEAESWAKVYEQSGDLDVLLEAAPAGHYVIEIASPPPAGLCVYVGYYFSAYADH